MSGHKKHIFVCENLRDEKSGRPSCARRRSPEMRSALKQMLKDKGLSNSYRVNQAGCLGYCEHGPAMVIYPQGIWYGHYTKDDLPEILEASILKDKKIARLEIK